MVQTVSPIQAAVVAVVVENPQELPEKVEMVVLESSLLDTLHTKHQWFATIFVLGIDFF
jgi:hypothetical protein